MTSRSHLEEILAVLDAHIASAPEAIVPRLQRGAALAALGRSEEAKQALLDVLKLDPRNVTAWIDLGKLLFNTGYTRAARTAYTAAVNYYPDEPLGHIGLAEIHVHEGDLAAALTHFEFALKLDQGSIPAHQGMSVVLLGMGEEEKARVHRQQGFYNWLGNPLPYRGGGEPIALLILMSASCGNVPWLKLVDDHIFLTTALVPECYDRPLPPHQLVFNSIGDPDLCQASLEAAAALLKQTAAPVINRPEAVLATGRAANALRLGDTPGVIAPRIAKVTRSVLAGEQGVSEVARHGLSFPLLLRCPGFHSGQHFVLVERPEELRSAAAALPGDELLVLEYLDARGRDGKARKYRVMIIDRQLYPLHLAISNEWKVHYYSGQMKDHPVHQAEESRFLNDMPRALGTKAMVALENIGQVLRLDYCGVDFGVREDGSVLLFEANATMTIMPPGPDKQWDYRRAAIDNALQAARRMLVSRAGECRSG